MCCCFGAILRIEDVFFGLLERLRNEVALALVLKMELLSLQVFSGGMPLLPQSQGTNNTRELNLPGVC